MAIRQPHAGARRNPGRRFGAEVMRLSDLPDRLHEFDAVVSCTASTLPIIGLGAVERALKKRRHRPMFMVDLAVPRDIEVEVKACPTSTSTPWTTWPAWCRPARTTARPPWQQAEAIIDAGVQSFMHWMEQRDPAGRRGAADPADLNAQADAWRAAELARAEAAGQGRDVDAVLEALSRGLTQKMLHGALAELHTGDAETRAATAPFRACSCASPSRPGASGRPARFRAGRPLPLRLSHETLCPRHPAAPTPAAARAGRC
jgi:glutamyl-tRNA reductase